MPTRTYRDEIKRHYEKVWDVPASVKQWKRGPIQELPNGFCVVECEPRPESHTWCYGTCCMSQPDDEEPLELHLLAPFQDESHVELLTIVSHYHRTASTLGLGHTVNFGRPWLPGATCSFGLISLPYIYGPVLENYRTAGTNTSVRFLWLLPITEREREYKKQNGLDALESQLERAVVNYLDPTRDSVV